METRINFFSNRVVEAWNMVPGVTKRSKTVSSFKNVYGRHREDIVGNAGIETENNQWRDHIRIQIHPMRP